MQERTFGKTIKNLLLALLNATLLLVFLCLLAGWGLANRVNSITSDFAASLISVQPLRDDVQAMTGEFQALRNDLAAMRSQSDDLRSQSAQRINAKLDEIGGRMTAATDRVYELASRPETLINHAIDQAAAELKLGIADLRGCTLPADPEA